MHTWTHSGVGHVIDSRGRCVTCGKPHLNREHRQTMDTYRGGEPCQMTAGHGVYPYDCERARKDPHALVTTCHTHMAWWVE